MKQLNVYDKKDTREEVLFMSEGDFDALQSMHTELVEEDFSINGAMHRCQNFDIVVDSADEEDIYEDDMSSVEEAIEILNSFKA